MRYNDGITVQDFFISPSSTNEIRDMLEFLADHGQIRATPSGNTMMATIDTTFLKQVVGGFPILQVTPGRLATECGFSYFNWKQTIEHVPGNMVFTKVFPNGSFLSSAPTPILDPIMYYPNERYRIFDPTNGLHADVLMEDEWLQTNCLDDREPYYSLNGLRQDENRDAYGYYYKAFEDKPSIWTPLTTGGAPDYLEFLTRLVGVNSNNDIVAQWIGIGTNFRWKTDSVNAERIAYLASANGGPPIVSGGVFDVRQDTGVVAHPGDFDSDGDVDGADFVAWQTNFPKATGAVLAEGDADGDGDVDGADFVVWQTNFPYTPSVGTSPIPEPTAATLTIIGLLGIYCRRRALAADSTGR